MSRPRLGLHLLTQADNQFYGNPSPERDLHIDTFRKMGVTDLKLITTTSSDSQVKAAKWLKEQGFEIMLRFYALPKTLPVPPTDIMRQYAAVGVKVVESVNEPEIEQGRPPDGPMITVLARQHINFADQCAHAGLKPLMPAFQGDRVYNWFAPFLKTVIDMGRKDVLEGSYVNVHPRPSNNLPDTAPPGFVPRSYELFDDTVLAIVGRSLPIYATEWGYEPGDDANNTLPKIDIDLHTLYNVRLQKMDWRDCLKVVYYWTWLPDWSNSGWWRGNVDKSLPVVKAFIAMHQAQPPPPPPPPPPADNVAAAMRTQVNTGLAGWPFLQKWIVRQGWLPLGGEVTIHISEGTFHGHAFVRPDRSQGIAVVERDHYQDSEVRVIAR